MASAQHPLLFIISEPVGSQLANHIAHRLADRGVRTWIGSLAPGGELSDTAMDTLRNSAAALLIFDEAAAQSRHVDRHLLVVRQSGKPLIPLRVQPADEGLLRQELLDAQWIDGSSLDAAIEEVSNRAFEHDRAQRERANAARAAATAAPAMAASDEGSQKREMPRIQVLGAGSAAEAGPPPSQPRIQVLGTETPTAAEPPASSPRIQVLGAEPAPAAAAHAPTAEAPTKQTFRPAERSRRSFLASPTMLLALLALVVIVGAVLYNSSLFQGDGERAERTVAERSAPVNDPAPAPSFNEAFGAETPSPVEPDTAAPAADDAPPADTPSDARPQEMAAADATPPPAPEDAPPPAPEEEAGGSGGVATVRAFYSALSRGDGASAAQHVVAGKRQSGPLSAGALSRYYSSFRRPLRIRGMTPVDANTVRVSYDYVLSDGRLCQGQATVNVVQSGGRGLVSGISTRGPC